MGLAADETGEPVRIESGLAPEYVVGGHAAERESIPSNIRSLCAAPK